MSKDKIIALFHNHLDNKGYANVRSNVVGEKLPPEYELESGSITLKPDVSAEIRGKKIVFEFVEARTSEKQHLIEKCRNYLKVSKLQGIKPRLIVPIDRYDSVLQWINTNQLEQIGLVRVNIKSALKA